MNDPILRLVGLGGRRGPAAGKGAGPSLLARPQAAIPQIDERRVACLQGVEPEAAHVALDVGAIEPLDDRFDTPARLPRRPRQRAPEEHVVLRLELAQLRLESQELTFDVGHLGHWASLRDRSGA
jgi:hypothetical protein